MKTRFTTALLVLCLGLATPVLARESKCDNEKDHPYDPDPLMMAGDVIIVRPGCLAATAVGTAVFVVALPVAAISGSVKKAACTLIGKPARATFTRRLGDMDALREY